MGARDATIGRTRIDPESWHGLEELRSALRSFLLRHCDDENELEDVIQETYLRAARYRSGKSGVLRLRPWTMRIALNVLSDWRRRGSRSIATPEEDRVFEVPVATPEQEETAGFHLGRWTLERESALGHLAFALGSLRERDRRVLESFYRNGRSARIAAAECDIPRHLVKIRLFRARQRLQRALRRRLAVEEGWSALAS